MPTSLQNFAGYENFVLENVIKSSLDTKLDVNRFMTPDYDLVENPGMTKKIHRYTVTSGSAVDDLSRGQGNSNLIEAEYAEYAYTVGRTQGQILYADDDVMTDPALVDAKVRFLTEAMVNSWTKKAIAEYNKSENICAVTGYSLESFANILGQYTEVYENTDGLFFLANQKLDRKIRKMLGDDLKYVEDYIRTGAIGAVLGVPVFLSKAVPEGIIFLATREAVKAFIKRDVSVEQDRDIDTKVNKVVASRYAVIALVDESKCVVAGEAQGTAVAISTKTGTTVAGTCDATADAGKVYVNGVEYTATVSGGSFTATVASMTAGDDIKVIISAPGKVNAIATAEAV